MSEKSFEEGFYKFLRKNLTANDLRMTEKEFKKLKKKECLSLPCTMTRKIF